jgi:hypothetical protein
VGPPGHDRGAVSRLGIHRILSVWSAGARDRPIRLALGDLDECGCVEDTLFALSRLRLGGDASATTRAIASPRDLGHRTRRLAEGRCCEVGRAHPPLVTIEDYDDAPQRKG